MGELLKHHEEQFRRMVSSIKGYFSSLTRDMTEYRGDAELKKLNLSLERQVNETKLALTQLREAQVELVRVENLAVLGDLVAGVAHEVNTPVGVAVTAASTLQYRTAELQELHRKEKLTPEDLDQYVHLAGEASELLLSNLQRAADLVQSFKQVAVDQNSNERRAFDLAEYIDEVLLSLASKIKNSRHHLTVDCPPSVQIDSYPGALFQILTNLVSNSLMHAFPEDRQGNISISAREEGDIIVMGYRDDGIGIPSANMRRVFEPFFTTKRGAGGSGLGLPIVHNLVTKVLGGSINVTSEPEKGIAFEITFPKIAPSPNLASTVPSTAAGGRG